MEALLQHLGVQKEDTMAIGDSTNDLPMFEVAGHTVCMGGGMDELKAQAEFITDTVMNDGIEKALKHFGLL
jgi:hydroxymethylpyrimidine pyrophosphatase-like HAD family hydrolase